MRSGSKKRAFFWMFSHCSEGPLLSSRAPGDNQRSRGTRLVVMLCPELFICCWIYGDDNGLLFTSDFVFLTADQSIYLFNSLASVPWQWSFFTEEFYRFRHRELFFLPRQSDRYSPCGLRILRSVRLCFRACRLQALCQSRFCLRQLPQC